MLKACSVGTPPFPHSILVVMVVSCLFTEDCAPSLCGNLGSQSACCLFHLCFSFPFAPLGKEAVTDSRVPVSRVTTCRVLTCTRHPRALACGISWTLPPSSQVYLTTSALQSKESRLREVKKLLKAHTARKWQSWDCDSYNHNRLGTLA